jgi:hypothetical protein
MTPEAQRIAIAEACGWTMPDYLNDLNAMHEALKVQTPEFRTDFREIIFKMANNQNQNIFELEADDWAEAFLRTIGKWEEA